MHLKEKIIVLRFSAMGDVAMVASVLKEFSSQNPSVELIMVSRNTFKPFFIDIPNLTFHAIQPNNLHKGVLGLYKLFQALRKYKPTAVADLHDNIRSRTISTFFRFAGTKIRRIDKGRAEKKALTRLNNKIFKPLRKTVERYADVFRQLNFKIELSHKLIKNQKPLPAEAKGLFKDHSIKKIGIAPFAQHIYKVYPLNKMEEVLADLTKLGYEVFIFGGGKSEQEVAEKWCTKFQNTHNLIGNFTLTEELNIISNLDLMLSMDSSGMHMASLMAIPVVSVWGPTHPYAGFLGYGQLENDCIQIDHPSRPNSIYGNKPCICGVESCMDLINPQTIVNKIKEKLNG
ncbi:lipopolysaccharide heptosyltransferase family protein [Pedobacter changchengzhani]|uniref:Lipopolysaccharide heptosyltransferase family protein n=1 Tax=Pedobacter changchengzhani TaxID=2529274 RepID=A0A4R5MNU7_9SPHI|nr:glycosyltransferase family 9 protein [Pedobacter changchengzhani]TDG37005.1 lipopolysaccharide heptosyltransferase family protein [Pedobacter changchengzhani]